MNLQSSDVLETHSDALAHSLTESFTEPGIQQTAALK
jgi:hypothetical protein